MGRRVRIKKLHHKKRRNAPGASPGTLALQPGSHRPKIRVISYSAETLDERTVEDPDEIRKLLARPGVVTWVDVKGLGDEGMLRKLSDIFQIHPLALEDVVHSPQRPKTEDYDEHQFIIARSVVILSDEDMEAEQVAIFLGKNYVLTMMEDKPDCFDPVRERLRKKGGVHRRASADYLCYSLLDAVIDNYFPALEAFGEYLESLEEQTVTRPTPRVLAQIHAAKRELLDLRRVLWPQREAINALIRTDTLLISPEVKVFLRDCYDHAVQVMDMVETYREITSGLHDVYLSSIGNRTNEIMKVLTIISTIFIPLTFIAGVYGMNFNTQHPLNMPELESPYGYPATMLVMALIALGLLYFFKRKGWIFSRQKDDATPVVTFSLREKNERNE